MGVEDPGRRPFLPARGTVCRLVELLPSSSPLYVTMANPHVVLCTAEVPQGVRASWGGRAAGRKTLGRPGDATCCWLGGAPGAKAVERSQKVKSQSVGFGVNL